MRLEDLRAFLTVVDQGSLAAAARALDLPKSTVSRRLDRLEEELDTQLTQRGPRRTLVTDRGQLLHRLAGPLVAELDRAAAVVRDGDARPSGVLHVTAPGDLTTRLLGGLCSVFMRRYPAIEIRLSASNRSVDLLGDGFDVALRVHLGPPAASHALKIRRLATIDIGLYAAPAYLDAHPAPRAPDGLDAHVGLTMEALGGQWTLAHDDGRSVRVEPTLRLRSTDHHALLDAAQGGAGIAALPCFVCGEAVAAGRLIRVLPDWSLPAGTLSILWSAERHPAPRVRAFIDHAVAAFAEWPALAAPPGAPEKAVGTAT